MKIAILTSVHPALDGRIFHKEAVSLARAGHAVTLYAPEHPQAGQVACANGIRYIALPTIERRVDRFRRWWALMKLLRQQHFDVWHFHDPELLPLVIVWRSLFSPQVQLVYDVHEDLPKNILDKPWLPKRLRKPIAFLSGKVEQWCSARCQLIVSATDTIGNRLTVAEAAQQSIVVRNYPLLNDISQPKESSTKDNVAQVIYCGSMTESRGIRETVEAMGHLYDCPVQLVLLGYFYPYSFEQEIRTLAGDNVIILPQVPFAEVKRYLAESDIGIVVLRPTPSYVESLPVKLFEYMEAGLAIIASDFPSWRQIVESAECGILVQPMNAHRIAEAIRLLVNDEGLRRCMGQAAAAAVRKEYSWRSQADELIRAYGRMAENQ